MTDEEISDAYYEILFTEGTVKELEEAKIAHKKAKDYLMVHAITKRMIELQTKGIA